MYENKQRILYDYGIPIGKGTFLVVEDLLKRVNELEKGAVFMVDGTIGSGKTVGAVQIADVMNGAYTLNEDGTYTQHPEKFIELKSQYSMGGNDFIKKLLICYKLKKKVLIYDEAGDFSKRSSLTKLNADMNRIFETCRALKIIIIMVLPNFFYIDRSLLDKEMIRGLARITRTTTKYSDVKIWGVEGINWIKYYSTKYPVPSQSYNFVKPILKEHILPLNEARMKELADISTKNKFNIITNIGAKELPSNMIAKHNLLKLYNVSNVTWLRFIKIHNIKGIKVGKEMMFDGNKIEELSKKYGIRGVAPDSWRGK